MQRQQDISYKLKTVGEVIGLVTEQFLENCAILVKKKILTEFFEKSLNCHGFKQSDLFR